MPSNEQQQNRDRTVNKRDAVDVVSQQGELRNAVRHGTSPTIGSTSGVFDTDGTYYPFTRPGDPIDSEDTVLAP